MQELAVENWIKNNIETIFPRFTLVSSNEILADRVEVAFTLRMKNKEMYLLRLRPRSLGQGILVNF